MELYSNVGIAIWLLSRLSRVGWEWHICICPTYYVHPRSRPRATHPRTWCQDSTQNMEFWPPKTLKQQSTIRYLTMYFKFKLGEVSTDNQLLLGHRNRSTCSRQTMRLYETCWSLDKAWPQYWFINTSSSSTHEPCGVSIEGDRVNNFYLKYVFMLNE